jgi:hypothetical protein
VFFSAASVCSGLVQELFPVVRPAHAAKAREYRALQTLCDIGCASLLREAYGVRPACSHPYPENHVLYTHVHFFDLL